MKTTKSSTQDARQEEADAGVTRRRPRPQSVIAESGPDQSVEPRAEASSYPNPLSLKRAMSTSAGDGFSRRRPNITAWRSSSKLGGTRSGQATINCTTRRSRSFSIRTVSVKPRSSWIVMLPSTTVNEHRRRLVGMTAGRETPIKIVPVIDRELL